MNLDKNRTAKNGRSIAKFPLQFFFHKVYILIFVLILYLIFTFTYFRTIKYFYMFPLKGVLVFVVLMKSRWRDSAGRKTDTQKLSRVAAVLLTLTEVSLRVLHIE